MYYALAITFCAGGYINRGFLPPGWGTSITRGDARHYARYNRVLRPLLPWFTSFTQFLNSVHTVTQTPRRQARSMCSRFLQHRLPQNLDLFVSLKTSVAAVLEDRGLYSTGNLWLGEKVIALTGEPKLLTLTHDCKFWILCLANFAANP